MHDSMIWSISNKKQIRKVQPITKKGRDKIMNDFNRNIFLLKKTDRQCSFYTTN